MLLDSKKRFRSLVNLPANVNDVILWKFSAYKGGGSWKFLVNPVNVEKPQSLRHLQPIYNFAANNSRENMRSAMFQPNSPHKRNFEDVVHRRCTLLHVKVGREMWVVLVKNLNPNHHRNNPMSLSKDYVLREHAPVLPTTPTEMIRFNDRVTSVDIAKVKSVQLLYTEAYL